MKQKPPTICTIYLTGAFRIEGSNGENLTPKSKVRCALLAVLAAANGQTVTRARLQTLLWGDSSEKQASGSLRSALFKLLNHDFAGLGSEFVDAHTNHVALRSGRWQILRDAKRGEFLEGLDLSLKGADDFEDWLREERMNEEVSYGKASALLDPPDNTSVERWANNRASLSFGILPVFVKSQHEEVLIASDAAIDGLIHTMAQLSSIAIFDLRGKPLKTGTLECSKQSKHCLLLRTAADSSGKHTVLRLSLIEPHTQRLVRSLEPMVLEAGEIDGHTLRIAELILGTFQSEYTGGVPVNLMPWSVLSSLFSLSPGAVDGTESEIDRLLDTDPEPALLPLKIFLQIFKENEGLSLQRPYELDELQLALDAVPITDPLRPLCESLVGYSAHMLCAENDISEFLLKTAYQRAPGLAINLDHLSALHFARGDLKSAVTFHEKCLHLSALSSWRYSYDITGAMIAMALGDYSSALRQSNRSLIQRPQFVGALRYTMIGFAMNNNAESAFMMRSRIRRLRPDYDLSGWIETFLRRTDPVFANNVAITLQRIELV